MKYEDSSQFIRHRSCDDAFLLQCLKKPSAISHIDQYEVSITRHIICLVRSVFVPPVLGYYHFFFGIEVPVFIFQGAIAAA